MTTKQKNIISAKVQGPVSFKKSQKAAQLYVLPGCNREGPISPFYAHSHRMQEKTLLAGLTLGHLDNVLGK